MDLTSILEKKQNYASRKIGGEYVIVPIKNNVAEMNTLINLNEVGSFIWDQLQEDSTVEAIELAIVAEFDVPQTTAQQDLAKFLDKLDRTLKL